MNTHIAVVTTEFLRDFLHSSLKSLSLPFEYSIHCYGSFSELSDIYLSLPANVSGIVTSGFYPAEILRRTFPDSPHIIHAINNDDADLFKLFFHLLQSNRSLSAERIYVDLLDELDLGVPQYLNKPLTMSLDSRFEQMAGTRSLEDLTGTEAKIRDVHLRLWQQGLSDISVTRFSGIVKQLHEAGLPVHFVYPNRSYMESVFKNAAQAIKLRALQDNQAAAIVLTVNKHAQGDVIASRLSELQRTLALFSSLTPMHLMARQMEQGIEVLLNRKSLEVLTDRFVSCKLQAFLQEHLSFPVYIGYGLGATVHQARINAIDASREASLAPAGSSCLINERDELICPMNPEKLFVVSRAMSPQIQEIAMRSGLSSLTLQKIDAAISSDMNRQITSENLAEKLSITKRSANRILSALRDSGAAQVVSVQRGTTRGRPERVYQIVPL